MSPRTIFYVLSMIAALSIPAAVQAAHMHAKHVAHHAGKGCHGTFMYMKGGKCMDARNKAA